MSVLRKIPYIESVIGSLNATQLGELKTAMNTASVVTNKSLITSGQIITNDDKGHVKAVNMELALGNIKSGFLIYTATYCVLIAYHRFQDLAIFNLNIANRSFEKVDEYCSIDELRRVCDEQQESGGDAWVETMKEVMIYDDEEEQVQVGTDLSVDGDVIVNELTNLKDTDGNPLIPDPMGHAGKFLKAGTTGLVWDTAGGSGTQWYEHTISDTNGAFSLYLFSTKSTAYTSLSQILDYRYPYHAYCYTDDGEESYIVLGVNGSTIYYLSGNSIGNTTFDFGEDYVSAL